MSEWLKFIAIIFATYRLSGLLSSEEGPYLAFLYKDKDQRGVFEWIRHKAGADNYVYEYNERGNQRVSVATNLGRGISCPLCVAGYIGFALTFLLFFDNIIINFFLIWLGVWGIQTFLENLTSDDAVKDAIDDVADSLEDT